MVSFCANVKLAPVSEVKQALRVGSNRKSTNAHSFGGKPSLQTACVAGHLVLLGAARLGPDFCLSTPRVHSSQVLTPSRASFLPITAFPSASHALQHFSRVLSRPVGVVVPAGRSSKRRSGGDSSSCSTGSSSASLPPNEAILGGLSAGGQLRLIPCESVILLYRLGEGEFGAVYHGQLITTTTGPNQPQQSVDVAVKVSITPFLISKRSKFSLCE